MPHRSRVAKRNQGIRRRPSPFPRQPPEPGMGMGIRKPSKFNNQRGKENENNEIPNPGRSHGNNPSGRSQRVPMDQSRGRGRDNGDPYDRKNHSSGRGLEKRAGEHTSGVQSLMHRA